MRVGLVRLLHFPPLWGIGYLVLIPLFATVFSGLPAHSFHDSNAELEGSIYSDATKLQGTLAQVMRSRLQAKSWIFDGRRVYLEANSLVVGALEHTKDDRLLMEVSGIYEEPTKHNITVGRFSYWIELAVREQPLVSSRAKGVTYYVFPVSLTTRGSSNQKLQEQPLAPPLSLLFPQPYVAIGPDTSRTSGAFVMPESVYGQLNGFYISLEGDPTYASGQWTRMLYLSAVTITTLGFGDITPLSDAARLWVGAEAVLGVIFVGLFLNALARVARRPTKTST